MKTEFYSLDKLVEFGLPATAANNMIDSMNQVFDAMKTPGVDSLKSNDNKTWADDLYYAVLDGEAAGPYSLVEIARLITEKHITKDSYIWKPGMDKWEYAENYPEILRLIAIAPPEVPPLEIVPTK